MYKQRMMEAALPPFQFDRNWMEARLLLRCQDGLNLIHIAGQARDRQKLPAMTARNIVEASVLARAVVQSDPACKVCNRFSASPIRVVLVPRHYSAVLRGFAEQLIVPEPNRAAQQLRRGHQKRRVPQNVVERLLDAPSTQRVEQDCAGVLRF